MADECFSGTIFPALIYLNEVSHGLEIALNFRIISNMNFIDKGKLFLDKLFCDSKIGIFRELGQDEANVVILG
jgi:hypothetical protein